MENIKNNADKLLYDFGLLNELKNYGTPYIVGSYAMDLMVWNDLDIYVSNEFMSTEKLYKLTSFILNTFHPVWYEAKKDIVDGKIAWFHGFETEVLSELWNIDIWFFDNETITNTIEFCNRIKAQADTDETKRKFAINIKQALIENEQYGFGKYTSMDVYRAVFEMGITNYDEFINTYKLI